MRTLNWFLFTLASVAVLLVAAPRPATAQPSVLPMANSQNIGSVEEAGYRYRYRYGYRPGYRRYGNRPYYRPYYGYYGYRRPYYGYGYGYGYRPFWRPGISLWFGF
jgi:hypothetical protein